MTLGAVGTAHITTLYEPDSQHRGPRAPSTACRAVNEAKEDGLALKAVWTEDWREACLLKIGKVLITLVDNIWTSLNAGWTS